MVTGTTLVLLTRGAVRAKASGIQHSLTWFPVAFTRDARTTWRVTAYPIDKDGLFMQTPRFKHRWIPLFTPMCRALLVHRCTAC